MPAARARTPARARAAACLTAAAAAVLALAGCSQVDAALSRQWAVVNFKSNTTVSTLLQVRQACSHVPGVRPLAVSPGASELLTPYSLRYETSDASTADLAALKACLQRFSAVSGVSLRDSASRS